jgi:hypothetical protein
VRVDTCVSCSSCQIFAFTERNVLAVRILKALSETKIDDENIIFVSIVSTNQEIVGLNISMNNTLLVNFLNTLNLFKHLYI